MLLMVPAAGVIAILSTEMIFCNESIFCEKLLSLSETRESAEFLEKWLDVK